MVRSARIVIQDFPHHVTDRGNRGCSVFFSDGDREQYLEFLLHYSRKRGLEIGAYCLMNNHVHFVAVPRRYDALARTIGPTHMRHAQKINKANGWRGHLWCDRFFSTPMDHDHFVAAVRYVESNPVRAGLVERAEDYKWSSAKTHVFGEQDALLSDAALFGLEQEVGDWSRWLGEVDDVKQIKRLKQSTRTGYPCGAESFVRLIGRSTGRDFTKKPRGRRPRALVAKLVAR